jgi:hypothetical protein
MINIAIKGNIQLSSKITFKLFDVSFSE